MEKWNLHIEGFGKIKKADIECSPLTLFVGDNNSGKSYLLSLLWGIYEQGARSLLSTNNRAFKKIFDELILRRNDIKTNFIELKKEFIEKEINDSCKKRKDSFVKNIFNSNKLSIDKLIITLNLKNTIKLNLEKDDKMPQVYMICCGDVKIGVPEEMISERHNFLYDIAWTTIMCSVLGINGLGRFHNNIFLPAARTGFMLTKDIINKVGRENTFDRLIINDEVIEKNNSNISPFTKPVIQFLNTLDGLSKEREYSHRYQEIITFIENQIIKGSIDITDDTKKEVQYIPQGNENSIPLRISSAVVSEISPLVLILKHKKIIDKLFYEEPEMCLHPGLQKLIARVICFLVKKNIPIIATTHSDIIIQHINNVIKLSSSEDEKHKKLIENLGYSQVELLKPADVKVYQFKNAIDNTYTEITELKCTPYGFEVPTFNNALSDILKEISKIQELESVDD